MSDNPEGPTPEPDISGRHQIQRPNVAVTGPFGVAFTAGCVIIGVCVHFDALGWGMVFGAACVALFPLWFYLTDQMQLADHKTTIGDTTYFLGFSLTLASIAIGFWLSERDLGSILPVIGTALGTSVAGVVSRVLLHANAGMPSLDDQESRVVESARLFTQRYEQSAQAVNQASDQLTIMTKRHMEAVGSHVEQYSENVDVLNQSVASLAQTMESERARLTGTLADLKRGMDDLGTEFGTVKDAAGYLTGQLGELGSEAVRAATNLTYLTRSLETLSEVTKLLEEFARVLRELPAEEMREVIALIVTDLRTLAEAATPAAIAIAKLSSASSSAGQSLSHLAHASDGSAAGLRTFRAAVDEVEPSVEKIAGSLRILAIVLDGLSSVLDKEAAKEVAMVIAQAVTRLNEFAPVIDRTTTAISGFGAAVGGADQVTKRLMTTFDETEKTAHELATQLSNTAGASSTFEDELKKLSDQSLSIHDEDIPAVRGGLDAISKAGLRVSDDVAKILSELAKQILLIRSKLK